MNFFGGDFFGGGFYDVRTIYVASGGGVPLGWRDHVLALHKKRMLERDRELYGRQLKVVQKKIKVQEKKAAKPTVQSEGILDNLWKLGERRDALQTKIRVVDNELVDMQTFLIAAGKMKEYEDEDDDDISVLLLS